MAPFDILAAVMTPANALLIVRRSLWTYPFGLSAAAVSSVVFCREKLFVVLQFSLFAIASGCTPPSADAEPPGLVIQAGPRVGQLSIANRAGRSQQLRSAVAVERFSNGGWQPIETEMNLVARCNPFGAVEPLPAVTVPPHATLTPPPWRGNSCSDQCRRFCRVDFPWGAGPFRFRVTVMPSGQAVYSNAFRMPAVPGTEHL